MSRCRAWIVWLLLLAVPVLGFSGAVAGLLGAKHSHSTSAAQSGPVAPLEDARRLSYGGPAAAPGHDHASWLRHHHPRQQADAISLDAEPQDSAPADSTSAVVPAVALAGGSASGFVSISAAAVTGGWPRAQASRIDRVAAQPLDRPPKA